MESEEQTILKSRSTSMTTIRRRQKRSGFVLIIMAAASIAMVGALGLAVDMGRVFIIKNETQHFCDSAALAAALQLDGTSAGVTTATSTATSLADNWNFGTTTVGSPTIEYATTSSGTWTNAPPNPPTNYIYARVKSSVSVPMYFLPVVMTTKVYTQTVNSQAIAGQVPVTTLNTGLSPYSAIAQDNTVSTLGLVKGQEYMIQQAHFSCPGPAPCGSGNSKCDASKPYNCFNGNICNDDTNIALWQAANIWGSSTSGYWGYTSNSLIRAAILDLVQLQPVGVCPWATFSTALSSCAAATNIQPLLSNGQKQQQGIDLDVRANEDTYILTVYSSGNNGNGTKHLTIDAAATWADYQTAQANGTANGRRLLTAPVVWPVTSTVQTTVAAYGNFLLETDVYSGIGTSNYYKNAGGGNDAFCAIYAGPPVLGGKNSGGSSSPGAYSVQLIS
jgi:Flp pilus assembly protein TadG